MGIMDLDRVAVVAVHCPHKAGEGSCDGPPQARRPGDKFHDEATQARTVSGSGIEEQRLEQQMDVPDDGLEYCAHLN